MNVLRKTALKLVTEAQYGRLSKKKMMFKAALNPEVLLNIILGNNKVNAVALPCSAADNV